ncbi:MAG: SCO family protein [Phycisphaerae bacterium]
MKVLNKKRLAFHVSARRLAVTATTVVTALLFILLTPHVFGSAFESLQTASQQSHDAHNAGITPHPGARLPLNLEFVNSHNQHVRLSDYFHKGRPVIFDFVYFRCPGVCPFVEVGLMHTMEKMSARLGSDYDVITISFDPTDTPAAAADKKAGYIAVASPKFKKALAAHWHFLTARESTIKAITKAVGFHYVFYPASHTYNHAAAIYIATPGGRLANYFYGIHYNPADLRLALVAAGNRKITNVFAQILLLCCQFDPYTGKYTAVARRVMLLGGVGVVISLGAFLGSMVWWERKHRTKKTEGSGKV